VIYVSGSGPQSAPGFQAMIRRNATCRKSEPAAERKAPLADSGTESGQ
jgi:hypothetical protein